MRPKVTIGADDYAAGSMVNKCFPREDMRIPDNTPSVLRRMFAVAGVASSFEIDGWRKSIVSVFAPSSDHTLESEGALLFFPPPPADERGSTQADTF